MSIWDEITSAADSYSLNDAKNGVGALFSAYTEVEAARSSSHAQARADQAAARYVPEVESQSVGEPVSVKFMEQEKTLVGDKPKDAAVIEKKWLYVGGGIAALLLLIGGIVLAVKK